ncbi:MAG: hypothetical protein LBU34_01045 [Planctomycetaceae bacterium]|nr:hypothetical protein [Planctomycetaceae bacterium]
MCITGGEAKRNRRIVVPLPIKPRRGEIINQHNHNLAPCGAYVFWGL